MTSRLQPPTNRQPTIVLRTSICVNGARSLDSKARSEAEVRGELGRDSQVVSKAQPEPRPDYSSKANLKDVMRQEMNVKRERTIACGRT